MDKDTKERLNAYLELLDEIKEKTDNEGTAVALLHEICKDRRMLQIKQEKAGSNNELATEKQKKFMNRLGIEFTDDITKKQASFLIDGELGKIDAD